VRNVDDAGLTGYRPLSLRAYRLTNNETAGKTVRQFLQQHPEYKIVNVGRGDERLGAGDDLVLQKGDVIALGGRLEAMTASMGLIGPEVADTKVLNIPIDQAEILVTNKEYDEKPIKVFRDEAFAGLIEEARRDPPNAGNAEERYWQILSHQLAVPIPEIGRQRALVRQPALARR